LRGGWAFFVSDERYQNPESPSPDEIRAARAAAGLTHTEAAAVIYCTLRAWQDWEAGKRAMHPAFFELYRLKAAGAP
jgi:putative transcriptional regulator